MKSAELRRALEAVSGFQDAEAEALPGRQLALAIAQFRADHDLTQAELGDRIGMSQPSVARLESGRLTPTIKVLNAIAKAFGTHWQVVFGDARPAAILRLVPVSERIGATIAAPSAWEIVPEFPIPEREINYLEILLMGPPLITKAEAKLLSAARRTYTVHTDLVLAANVGLDWSTPSSAEVRHPVHRLPALLSSGRRTHP